MLAAAGPGATLFGHSYGAIVAAAAAAAGADISALVLYEPPLPVNGPTREKEMSSFAAAVAAGARPRTDDHGFRHRENVRRRCRAHAGDPLWAEMVGRTPTLERELRTVYGLAGDLDRFTAIRQRTLLLLGSESPQHQVDATQVLAGGLPDATVVELAGQQHHANVTAPVALADAVRSFLRRA